MSKEQEAEVAGPVGKLTRAEPGLLEGFARCGECGGPMVTMVDEAGTKFYVCMEEPS